MDITVRLFMGNIVHRFAGTARCSATKETTERINSISVLSRMANIICSFSISAALFDVKSLSCGVILRSTCCLQSHELRI